MLIGSVNANKRLGSATASACAVSWARRRRLALLVVQEPWRGSRSTAVSLPGWSLVAGDSRLAVWTPHGQRLQTSRPYAWWATVRLQHCQLHSVHLDPYASSARAAQLQVLTASLDAAARHVILGDFNLAPRPADGRYGEVASTFTSAAERAAFRALLDRHRLRDSTERDPPVFTFERSINGRSSRFRCDLALVPADLPCGAVETDTETRRGSLAFTDHAAILVDISFLGTTRGSR
jgi:endonuclease/exonuclease/phosphatase family metal-dependent hydrolase